MTVDPRIRTGTRHDDGRALLERLRAGESADSLDLRDADLSGENLQGANLAGADLRGANLSRADLTGANLFKAQLAGAELSEARLDRAELTGACLDACDLREASAVDAGLGKASLVGANLFDAKLEGATLSGADLTRTDLRCAMLHRSRMREVDLTGADLTGADLTEVDLALSRVDGASFRNVTLRGSSLRMVRGYEKASWIGADLRDINFAGAYQLRRFVADQNYIKEFREHDRLSALVYHVWWITSDCGRSMTRWALCITLVSMLFAWAYTFVGIDYGRHETAMSPFYYSVVTLTTLGYGDVVPATMAAQTLALAEVLTGYFLLGGLLSILANKMARRAD